MSLPPARLNSKQSDANNRRIRMTQQRRALSNKIRKQKKSDYLARKRNTGQTNSTYSPSENLIRDLLNTYISSPTAGSLQALHNSLPASTGVVNGTEEKPLLFLSAAEEATGVKLLEVLLDHAIVDSKLLTLCLNVLVKLSAISYSSIGDGSYYGRIPSSWCLLMVQNPRLISLIMKSARKYDSCLTILGNLTGDPSSQVCPALRQQGLVATLLSCIEQPVAVWALTNAIRNDTSAWASVYCSEQLLSASMLESLLKSPQVATQAAWMTAALTSREEAVVQYLVSHPSFCVTIVGLVEQQAIGGNEQLIPLLQSLGYIASYAANVPPLLNLQSLTPTLNRLLESNVSKEVTADLIWLIGCLLVDARIENHPSTTIASSNLVPPLFQRLDLQHKTSLEERRDVAHALWNALALPPECDFNPNLRIVAAFLPDRQLIRSSLPGLIGLLTSPDADAMIAAVHVLNLLLIQDESLQVYMEESNVQPALEHVCESPVEEASEVAADILDNFFYVDDQDDEMLLPQPTNTTFSFGLPDPAGATVPAGRGMGRGRGATLPSWMSKN
eukprot:scaffold2649_cov137-Cylindrotheca_fusiformis.AAC.3